MAATTPEGKVKKKVKDILDLYGAYWTMPIGTGWGNAGVPDFVACYKGKFIGIECKANGNKPTALQLSNLDQIIEAGGHSLIIDETNVSSLTQLLESIK